MATWRTLGVILVFAGMMWMVSPLLRWAVLGDFGTALSASIFVAIGAAFLVGGVFVLRSELE